MSQAVTDRVIRNATMAVLQVLISSAALFFVFRFLLQQLGADAVGVWALVLATTSASRITELGLAGSAVKFVARAFSADDYREAAAIVQTSMLTVLLILSAATAFGYPLFSLIVTSVVPESALQDSLSILPYALISVVLGGCAGVVLSSLDGCHRADIRALISMSGTIVFVGLVWFLVPTQGLQGLARAHVAQAAYMLIVAWFALRHQIALLPVLPWRWSRRTFLSLYKYGLSFQVIALFGILYIPLTKVLVTYFGGLSATAYFEMAHRLVMQVRSLVASANQVIVPQIASDFVAAPERISSHYTKSYGAVFAFSFAAFFVLLGTTPLIGFLWVGQDARQFVEFSVVLTIAYLVNALSAPAYFVYLGTGRLRWNVISHVLLGILTALGGALLGKTFGGVGVVLGSSFALIITSSLVIWRYHAENRLDVRKLLPNDSGVLAIIAGVSGTAGLAVAVLTGPWNSVLTRAVVGAVIATIPIAACVIWHPMAASVGRRILHVIAPRSR